DPDTGVGVAGAHSRNGGGDLRGVGAERGDDAEQRFREPEALADAVELPREHETRGDRDGEAAREHDDGQRRRHGRKTLAARKAAVAPSENARRPERYRSSVTATVV